MKKTFILAVASLTTKHIFSQNIFYRYDDSTWYSLFVYAIAFVILISYLFVRYKMEQTQKSKDPADPMNAGSANDASRNQANSDDIFRLFMLKRKGVITELEYHQKKMRALKKKKNPFRKMDNLRMAQ